MNNFKVFNKLVRDKIPEILMKNGCEPEVEILSDDAYVEALSQKLLEEANEVISAEDKVNKIEEIADVLEVIYAIMGTLEVTSEDVENVRLQKKEKRGGFNSKILLKKAVVVKSLN